MGSSSSLIVVVILLVGVGGLLYLYKKGYFGGPGVSSILSSIGIPLGQQTGQGVAPTPKGGAITFPLKQQEAVFQKAKANPTPGKKCTGTCKGNCVNHECVDSGCGAPIGCGGPLLGGFAQQNSLMKYWWVPVGAFAGWYFFVRKNKKKYFKFF